MIDQFGRKINYMRISVTDRCNLRCRYCMPPSGVVPARHADVLRYEEILRVCTAAASLGIVNFKVTGGEPLARKGCAAFIARLKQLPDVQKVTLTSNGLLLPAHLDALCAAGINGINISLDTLCGAAYSKLTGYGGDAVSVLKAILADCVARGIPAKVNTVLLKETFPGLPQLAKLAREMPVDVRFIELMPIGAGKGMAGVPMEDALRRLREMWPDLQPTAEKRGNGPASYYAAAGLKGRIGFIGAVSHQFCGACNRVRLTSVGVLKPCLCYEEGADIGRLLRSGCSDEALRTALRDAIEKKPATHSFARDENITEHKTMNQIGG